jgi:hypothetical protein
MEISLSGMSGIGNLIYSQSQMEKKAPNAGANKAEPKAADHGHKAEDPKIDTNLYSR